MGVITDELCLPPQGVIVVWEWEWIIENDLYTSVTHVSETEGSIDHISETSLAATSDSDETNCNTPVDNRQCTSTVTFKCIGAQHDPLAQSVLRRVSGYLDEGQEVPVNIYPEPTNQYDAKAIAFKCWIDNDWHRIGYVVREALDSVHDARESGSILEVKFSWAKYLVTWMRSGPGYYAGINITRVGQWNTAVHQCASTR